MTTTNINASSLTQRSQLAAYALAGTLSVIGIVSAIGSEGQSRSFSLGLLVGGLGAAGIVKASAHLRTPELGGWADRWQAYFANEKTALERKLSAADAQIANQLQQIKNLQAQLSNQREKRQQDNSALTDKQAVLSARESELIAAGQTIRDLQAELVQERADEQALVASFTRKIQAYLNQQLDEVVSNLRASATSSRRKAELESPGVAEKFSQYLERLDEFVSIWQETIAALTPNYADPLDDLDEFMTVQAQLNDELSSLRVRYRNLLNVTERQALKTKADIIDKAQSVLENEVVAKTALIDLKDEALSEIESLRERLETLRSESDELEEKLDHAIENAGELVGQARAETQAVMRRSHEPRLWPRPINQGQKAGNSIIQFLSSVGLWVERCHEVTDAYESSIWFHGPADKVLKLDELNKHSETLAEVVSAIKPVVFKREGNGGLFSCVVHFAAKPKPIISGADVAKLWKPASKFPEIVSNWSRIRLTGPSEGGKSPTAENIAVCIQAVKGGAILRFDPEHNSDKNHWSIPVLGKSHRESEKAIASAAQLVEARSQGQEARDEFRLYVFDEIDSTISSSQKKAEISANVCFFIKQASHQRLGAIFIGQSPNVSEYPGLTRGDWNSAVNVHITANAYEAIENSNRIKGRLKDELLSTADKLMEYCEQQNQRLHLVMDGPEASPHAYRFALVVESNKRPYFIELPAFGEYRYPQPSAQAVSLSSPEAQTTVTAETVVRCPSCGSTNIGKKGNGSKGRKRYVCKNRLCSTQSFQA